VTPPNTLPLTVLPSVSKPSAYFQKASNTSSSLQQRPTRQSYEEQQNAIINRHLEAMTRIRTSPRDNPSKENSVRRTLAIARQLKLLGNQVR
jgi:hypothetical protein